MKKETKEEIKEKVVGCYSLDFDDTPTWDDVEELANWMNRIIVNEGAKFFAPVGGDYYQLMAFKETISPVAIKGLEDFDDFDFLDELEESFRK